ncbi:unnamed protein product [Durusdinium trenchii]|uniref:Uncharacterized protein n=1 Tax=Durusdinium trenchii TaxID=1381693 RepID=A0ABP0SIV8_9DINO
MLFAEDEYEKRKFLIDVPEGVRIPSLGDETQLSVELYGWPMGVSGAITWRGVWAALPLILQRAEFLQGAKVLELGAGCGLLANTAAVLGASCMFCLGHGQRSQKPLKTSWTCTGAHSTATDGNEEEIPLLQKNAFSFADGLMLGGSLSATHLEWGQHAAERSGLPSKGFDLIVGSEIVYIPDCIPALVESLCFFLADDGEAIIANTAVATRTDQSAARELLCECLEAKGLTFNMDMPPRSPPPPDEDNWAETSYILYIKKMLKIIYYYYSFWEYINYYIDNMIYCVLVSL